MHFIIFLLFIFVSIIFIFLVILQKGKGIKENYSINNLGIYSNNFSKNNLLVRLTSFFAIIFFILNLLLFNIVINTKNKSTMLKNKNTFVSSSGNEYLTNQLKDIPE